MSLKKLDLRDLFRFVSSLPQQAVMKQHEVVTRITRGYFKDANRKIWLLLSVPLWGGIVEWAKIIESYGVSAPIRWLRDDEFWLLAVNSNLSL
jgi:hypothetical protein